MDKNTAFAVIGGDMRQAYLATLLKRDGFIVRTYALEHSQLPEEAPRAASLGEALSDADCVVLPLPCVSEGDTINTPLSLARLTAREVFSGVRGGAAVLAGRAGKTVLELAQSMGITLVDYFEREELAVLNSIPTAEGAIQLAMEEMPVTLHGCSCLVIGFGRLGKVLASLLKGLGVKVTVAVRKYADRAWLNVYGYPAADSVRLWQCLDRFDLVINTVPARVLGRRELECVGRECLCIDLASKPGGIDFSAAQQLGVRCIWALSLPGKVAPYTSGEIIRDTVYNILEERCPQG